MAFTFSSPIGSSSSVMSGGSPPDFYIVLGLQFRAPIDSAAQVMGNVGLFAATPGLLVTVLIAGVDRTGYVGVPGAAGASGIVRVLQVGSSGSNCQFPIIGKDQADPAYRPNKLDQVVIYEWVDGTPERWFCGFIDNFIEKVYPGTNYVNLLVTAVAYGSLLDRRYVARKYIPPYVILSNIVLQDLIWRYFGPGSGSDTGLVWGGSSGDAGVNIGQPVFNYVTGAAAVKQICDMNAWSYWVDAWQRVIAFPYETGTGPAPIEISDSGGTWISIEATRNGLPYANDVWVRNSQDLQPFQTDEFVGDGSSVMFLPSQDLQVRPEIAVNGVAIQVTDFGVWAKAFDAYWLVYAVVLNAAPGVGVPVTVTYPSQLSNPTRSKDGAEIALRGDFQYLEEVQDVPSLDMLQQIGDGLLDKLKADTTDLVIVTDKRGVLPGQLLTVNTELPPINDTFLVEEVDSQEIGKSFFRHTIKATNAMLARTRSGIVLFQKLLAAAKQPKDRTTYQIGWTVAETVYGPSGPLTNPGTSISTAHPTITAKQDGVAQVCTFSYQTPPTVTGVRIDIRKNGASIFPTGDPAKMNFPAGATQPQTVITFLTNPLYIKTGDVFTMEVAAGDATAMDGSVVLTILG